MPDFQEFDDLWTEQGARRLALEIFHYWALRGSLVRVEVHREANEMTRLGAHSARHIWVVRSDLVNGLPRGPGNERGCEARMS